MRIQINNIKIKMMKNLNEFRVEELEQRLEMRKWSNESAEVDLDGVKVEVEFVVE